jgi:hypothetical protein
MQKNEAICQKEKVQKNLTHCLSVVNTEDYHFHISSVCFVLSNSLKEMVWYEDQASAGKQLKATIHPDGRICIFLEFLDHP